ncbi:TPA: hypothetical protein N0F65_001449 [Lagenidium giganteum]|uniref:Uncharacterized protein n=1 Tax=Lagenidium giganteum TaxID=4803 RepID=A0AAV2Z2A8_9STRA|nr:TPA: hypothetical protein N0F65_001449 [Lagenidium giganteum]
MLLSSWQRGTCFDAKAINSTHFEVTKVIMDPIFSGSGIGDTRNHGIEFWIKKWGIKNEVVEKVGFAPVP